MEYPALPGHPSRAPDPASPAPAGRRWPAVLGLTGGLILIMGVVLILPRFLLTWDLASAPAPANRSQAVNAIRGTLMQGLAGLAVLIGAYFTWRQLQVTRQGQVTDRYTKATEQLGNDSVEVRVGAVYALERIARDSDLDRLTIQEVLTAFLRLNAGLRPSGTDERPRPKTPQAKLALARTRNLRPRLRDGAPHLQAAATVLGRLPTLRQSQGLARVDLSRADLEGARFVNADLHYSDLSHTRLLKADLRRADLTGVWFVRTLLVEATLHQADLRDAVFWEARMDEADLRATDLSNADFTGAFLAGAKFDEADLRGADFSSARIDRATFTQAVADDSTIWPTGFDANNQGIRVPAGLPPLRRRTYYDELKDQADPPTHTADQ